MVAIKSLAVVFGLASLVAASHLPTKATPVERSIQDLSDSLASRSLASRSLAYNHHDVLVKRGAGPSFNPFYTTQFSRYVGGLSDNLRDVKRSVQSTCRGVRNGPPSTQVIKTLHTHLRSCKQHVSKCHGQIHHIPHMHHPSGTPGLPPTIPSCSGQLAEVVLLLEEILKEIHDLAKNSPTLALLLKAYISDIDDELNQLLGTSNSVVPQTLEYTRRYTTGVRSNIRSLNMRHTYETLTK
ncbi:hypothetical protein BT69DRAFT_1278642 [Atractiella rhizophila]|nr:hypothetical protein BT69DRAFT_1278642 [Atractiella rhizophila]